VRWIVLALAVGCGGGEAASDTGDEVVDTASTPTVDTAGIDTGEPGAADTFCRDNPVTTWENFGSGFVTQHCQSCHAVGAQERNGAPDDVTFDDEQQVAIFADRVLARVVDDATMPPQGGVTDDERHLVEVWLRCWLP
jgi:uncharacterized membrane protein